MMKYDEIHIEDLEIYARHGVFPEETKLGQRFIVSYYTPIPEKQERQMNWNVPLITVQSVILLQDLCRRTPIN